MAISWTHYRLLKRLSETGCIARGSSLLEIGKANFYGDWDASCYASVEALYAELFAPSEIVAIDGDPTVDAIRHDLNEPLTLSRRFGCVINHGTAEHVFNVANVFRLMHDHCEPGGLMIHEAPCTGWLDHGFYCLQPTLFWDVAYANCYQIMLFATEHLASRTYEIIESREELLDRKRRGQLADNLMLFVALRRVDDSPFRVPMQGVYAGRLSDFAAWAWGALR